MQEFQPASRYFSVTNLLVSSRGQSTEVSAARQTLITASRNWSRWIGTPSAENIVNFADTELRYTRDDVTNDGVSAEVVSVTTCWLIAGAAGLLEPDSLKFAGPMLCPRRLRGE